MSRESMIKSDLERIDEMSDAMIDYSDIPRLSEEQLSAMKPLREVLPNVYSRIQRSIRLDEDVISWFKKKAKDAGTDDCHGLVNAALRQYIAQHG